MCTISKEQLEDILLQFPDAKSQRLPGFIENMCKVFCGAQIKITGNGGKKLYYIIGKTTQIDENKKRTPCLVVGLSIQETPEGDEYTFAEKPIPTHKIEYFQSIPIN